MFIGSNVERNNCSEKWLRQYYSLNKAYFAPLQNKLTTVASQISMKEVEMAKHDAILGGAKQLLGIEVVNIPSIIYGGS